MIKKIIDDIPIGECVNYEKFIAQLCITWGASRRKVREYIQDLILTEYIERDGNELYKKNKAISKQEASDEADRIFAEHI